MDRKKGSWVILACVYKTGGDFTTEYVRRLTGSMREHSKGCRVVCLSDDPYVSQYAEHIPLFTNFTGWWAKLELFQFVNEPVLYFDLDTVIKGDLTPLIDYPHTFTMLSDFYAPQRPASGVMAFNGDYRRILDGFGMDKASKYKTTAKWGDQGLISEYVNPARFDGLFPGMIASYKANNLEERNAASVVCFHGKPRPHEVNWCVD